MHALSHHESSLSQEYTDSQRVPRLARHSARGGFPQGMNVRSGGFPGILNSCIRIVVEKRGWRGLWNLDNQKYGREWLSALETGSRLLVLLRTRIWRLVSEMDLGRDGFWLQPGLGFNEHGGGGGRDDDASRFKPCIRGAVLLGRACRQPMHKRWSTYTSR